MKPSLLLTLLLPLVTGAVLAAGEVGLVTAAVPVPESAPVASPDSPGGSASTAKDILTRILAQADAEVAARREFEQTHAYVVEKVTERRDEANRLRDRKVEREEHDPRTEPVGDSGKGHGYREKDFKVEQAMLDRYRITLAGVEEVNGRPAWALEFEPADPPAPAHGIKERFLNQTAGRVWVDQEDGTMARLELRLVKPVNVIGGLVGAVKACQVFVQRERASSGLWFNAHMRWRLEGRRLLVTNVMVFEERRTEVRQVIEPATEESPPGSAEAGETPAPSAPPTAAAALVPAGASGSDPSLTP